MAPEQVEGGEITHAADLYAFGVVMFEVLTGQTPFGGETPLSIAVKRLTQPPPSPRILSPELGKAWERIVLKCLERDPGRRFASAEELQSALESVGEGATARVPRARGRVPLVRPAFALLILSVAAFIFHRARTAAPSLGTGEVTAPAGRAPARRSIAVLGFRNLSARPEAGWLSTALSEMLGTELGAGDRLRLIPAENVARMKQELSLGDSDSLEPSTLSRIRSNLGSDVVVIGSYLALGEAASGQLRLDVRLEDARSGEVIAQVAEAGTERGLFQLVSRVGERLRKRLGVAELSSVEAGEVEAALPRDHGAARLYVEGLERLRLSDALAARELLSRATLAEPGHALAHGALSRAWTMLGYDARAKEEAKRAFDLSGKLPRDERLAIEGRFRETTAEWGKAIECDRTLFELSPDNLDFGLRLAEAQLSAGQGKDSLLTTAKLRQLAPPDSDDPRIDLDEADAALALGDHLRSLAAVERAIKKCQAKGARLLLARAELLRCRGVMRKGDLKTSDEACEEARLIYEAAGERRGRARALNELAANLSMRGELERARKIYDELLMEHRELGDRNGMSSALNNIAVLIAQQGDVQGSITMYAEALAIARETGDKAGAAIELNNIAEDDRRLGELKQAQRSGVEALAAWREIDDRSGVAAALNTLATIALERGDLSVAHRQADEALTAAKASQERGTVAVDQLLLGQIAFEEGELKTAREDLEGAAKELEAVGDLVNVAECRVRLATLANEEERFADAEREVRLAIAEFRKERAIDGARMAHAVLAVAEAGLKHEAATASAIEEAVALERSSGDRVQRLRVRLYAARVNPDRKAALRALKAVQAEAGRLGLVPIELESRLQEVRATLDTGDRQRAASLSERLQRDAAARGFQRVAHAAAALNGA
jgi:tetratricopeptide (TPR) repeat protein